MANVEQIMPSVPCTKDRVLAHHWLITQNRPGNPYAEGHCKHCRKRRLFKMAWPNKLDWRKLATERQEEEKKRFGARVQ